MPSEELPIDKLIIELSEVSQRMEKLSNAFLDEDKLINAVGPRQAGLLRAQWHMMNGYRSILQIRLDDLEGLG